MIRVAKSRERCSAEGVAARGARDGSRRRGPSTNRATAALQCSAERMTVRRRWISPPRSDATRHRRRRWFARASFKPREDHLSPLHSTRLPVFRGGEILRRRPTLPSARPPPSLPSSVRPRDDWWVGPRRPDPSCATSLCPPCDLAPWSHMTHRTSYDDTWSHMTSTTARRVASSRTRSCDLTWPHMTSHDTA